MCIEETIILQAPMGGECSKKLPRPVTDSRKDDMLKYVSTVMNTPLFCRMEYWMYIHCIRHRIIHNILSMTEKAFCFRSIFFILAFASHTRPIPHDMPIVNKRLRFYFLLRPQNSFK